MTPNQDHITGLQQGYHLCIQDAKELIKLAQDNKQSIAKTLKEGLLEKDTTDRLSATNKGYQEWFPTVQQERDNWTAVAIILSTVIGMIIGYVIGGGV